MTDHHTYGTSAHTAGELARLAGDRLGVVITQSESDYRGTYHLADSPDGRIEIQPNPIPAAMAKTTSVLANTRRPRCPVGRTPRQSWRGRGRSTG
jgi:hypothetical protein